MPFMPNKLCKACQIILQQKIGERANSSKLFRMYEDAMIGKKTFRSVQIYMQEECGVKVRYAGLLDHKKHQSTTERRIAQAKAKTVVQDQEFEAKRQSLHHSDRRSAVMDKLTEMMEDGTLKGATFTALANLLKQDADIEAKEKDRELEYAKLYNHFLANPLPPKREWIEGKVVEGEIVEEALLEPGLE